MRVDVPTAEGRDRFAEVPFPDAPVIWALEREVVEVKDVLRLRIEGDPKSKARPRTGKNGHVYTPKDTMIAEEVVALQVKSALRGRRADDGSYGVMMIFFTKNRQRRDVDNMTKLILDALTATKAIWDDDSQCLEISARLVRADAHPRTHLYVYEVIDQTMRCARSGCRGRRRSERAVYCSKECHDIERPLLPLVPLTCSRCGVQFVRHRGGYQAKNPLCRKGCDGSR